jgi:hypothetical protein
MTERIQLEIEKSFGIKIRAAAEERNKRIRDIETKERELIDLQEELLGLNVELVALPIQKLLERS